MKGMSIDEIGKYLDMTPETVQANLAAALVQLVKTAKSAKV